MKTNKILLIVLLLLALVGCDNGELVNETVHNKKHEEAYTRTKSNVAMQLLLDVVILDTEYVPESWNIEIKSEYENGTYYSWKSVSEDTYNKYQIGDTWNE